MTENIHTAILEVMKKVGYVHKGGRVSGGGANYSYAGEADLISALRPAMIEAGVYMHVVSVQDIQREAFTNSKGTHMINTALNGALRFTHAPSGTSIDVGAAGEGTDSGDKGIPKAMTSLFKYALRQTFCIETGDDPDAQGSDEQERSAEPTNIDFPDWAKSLEEHAKTKGLTLKDIPDLKLGPHHDRHAEIAHLKMWAGGLKPKPQGQEGLLAAFQSICEGVIPNAA